MTVREIELEIINQIISDAFEAGYGIGVHDGEELVLKNSFDRDLILSKLYSVDEEHLYFYKNRKAFAWVWLIHGNEGWDLIADCSVSAGPLLEGTRKVSDKYC